MLFLYLLIGIILLVALTQLLPAKIRVERSLFMAAPAATIFSLVNNLEKWPSWMPWAKFDPTTKYEFFNGGIGKGAYYTWDSTHKKVGNGKLTILESEPNSHLKTQLDFGNQPNPGYGGWRFEETEGGTNVTWSMDADMGRNPIGRVFGLFFDKMLGPQFEEGLQNLKDKVE
ncbi:MAG: SRPBCC family protein [Bacteroidota bacterium]